MSYDFLYKIVIMGDSNSGKTCFLNKYISNINLNNSLPTIGVDFNSKIVEVSNNKKVKIQLWDTSGNKNFRSIARTYFMGVAGGILIYNTAIRDTFGNLTAWLDDFNLTNNYKSIPIMLIGANFGNHREVSLDEGRDYAKINNLFFSEINLTDKQPISSDENELLQPLLDGIWERYILQNKVCTGVKKMCCDKKPQKPQKPQKPPTESIFKRAMNELKLHKDDLKTDGCIIC